MQNHEQSSMYMTDGHFFVGDDTKGADAYELYPASLYFLIGSLSAALEELSLVSFGTSTSPDFSLILAANVLLGFDSNSTTSSRASIPREKLNCHRMRKRATLNVRPQGLYGKRGSIPVIFLQ
jgi:hypothetical protein